jgi:hypothetical protein
MRSLARGLAALGTLALVLLVLAADASAQSTNVMVLGLTSLEGDDAFASDLSAAVRRAAGQVRGWAVPQRDVLLSQLEIALGCEAAELSCVQQLAETVAAQRLVYGTVERSPTGAGRYDFRVRIQLYDVATRSVLRSIDERVPSGRTDIDDLRGPARRWVGILAESVPPEEQPGAPGDARPGSDDPSIEAPDVEAAPEDGSEASGGLRGQDASTTSGGDDLGRLNWPAFALLAVGVGSAVAWIVAGLEAQTNQRTVATFRDPDGDGTSTLVAAPGETNLSICNPANVAANTGGDPARAAPINGACSSSAEVLQFVFMGAAVLAGAAGAGLLAANGFVTPAQEPDRVSLRLLPRASLQGGWLGLELTF